MTEINSTTVALDDQGNSVEVIIADPNLKKRYLAAIAAVKAGLISIPYVSPTRFSIDIAVHTDLKARFTDACREVFGPDAELQVTLSEVRILRGGSWLCVPYPILAGLDVE